MFEQIVRDKPACFGNEPLSPSLLGARTVSYLCMHVDVYIYAYIVYEYENGRCAEATLYLSLFIRQVEPSASLFIQSSWFRAERVSSRS